MNREIVTLVSVALIMSGLSLAISGNHFEGNFEIIEEGKYCTIIAKNSSYLYKEGYPVLPYKVHTYTYPAGTEIKNIEVKVKNIEKIKLQSKIKPAPPAVPLNMKNIRVEAKEGEIYEKDEFYPEKWYDYKIHAGIKDGKHVIFLSIYLFPCRYNAVRDELLYCDDFDVSVSYARNPTIFTADEYDLLIISPDSWTDELQALKEHKEGHGIRTMIKGTGEIYAQYNGRDEAEKIKYAIKDAIEKFGIKYVLLVGDVHNIPARYAYIPSGTYETSFPSDLYYADIYFPDETFSSWDTNGNNRFAEYRYHGETDEVDLSPDVAIGRIACNTESEVVSVINKIIGYENNAYNASWFRNILVCGGDTFPPSDGDKSGVYEGEYLNEIVLKKMSEFNGIKLWASLGNLSASNIKSKINEGVGFVDFSGHGNWMSWATHPPLDGEEWIGFTTLDISPLSNGEKLPVIVINACSCGRFDKECFAWKFVEKSNGGAIATLAASGIGYGMFGTYSSQGVMGWMETHFFHYYTHGKDIIGDIWTSSLNGYLTVFRYHMDDADYKTVEEWTLFGDPTLKIGGYEGGNAVIYIDKPLEGYLYIANRQILPTLFGGTIVIGKINLEVSAYNIEKVEFYIDNELKYTDEEAPYEWLWDEFVVGRHTVKVIGYGIGEAQEEKSFFIINI